jgi:hypothetical protein
VIQNAPNITCKSKKAAKKNRALDATIATFDHFKQRVISQSIFTNSQLPGSSEEVAFGDVAWL